jgi:hypothetical protein
MAKPVDPPVISALNATCPRSLIAMKEIVYHGLHSARVIAHEWI